MSQNNAPRGNPRDKLMGLYKKLKDLEAQEKSTQKEQKSVKSVICAIWIKENLYWRKRTCVKWLSNGDQNTKIFSQTVVCRKNLNRVVKLKDLNSASYHDMCVDDGLIQVYFSKNFFQAKGCHKVDETLQVIFLVETNEGLTKMPTFKEVQKVIFNFGKAKASCSNGFNEAFYRRHYEDTSIDVFEAVKNFFENGFLPLFVNEIGIALVPKVFVLEYPSQFRSIALCNFSYKIVSKVLMNRLKSIMNSIFFLRIKELLLVKGTFKITFLLHKKFLLFKK